jgi:hypothetical protein
MHQVQIDIVQSQRLETGIKAFLDAVGVDVPQLGGDKEVLALDEAGVDGGLDALADILLVLVGQRSVNMAVPDLDGMIDGLLGLLGRGLPCSYAGLVRNHKSGV